MQGPTQLEQESTVTFLFQQNTPDIVLSDLVLIIRNEQDQVIISRTLEEFTQLSGGTWKITFPISDLFKDGTYFMTVTAREQRFNIEHEQVYTIEIIPKKFMTRVYQFDSWLRYLGRSLRGFLFGY